MPAGASWSARTAVAGLLTATMALPATVGTLQSLAVDPDNYNNVFVTDNSHVYASTGGGTTWTEITGNLPSISSV